MPMSTGVGIMKRRMGSLCARLMRPSPHMLAGSPHPKRAKAWTRWRLSQSISTNTIKKCSADCPSLLMACSEHVRRRVAAGCIWEHGRWQKRADGHGRGTWYNAHESQGSHHHCTQHCDRRSTDLSNRFAPLASTDQEDGDLNDYTSEYRQAAQGRDKDVMSSRSAGTISASQAY